MTGVKEKTTYCGNGTMPTVQIPTSTIYVYISFFLFFFLSSFLLQLLKQMIQMRLECRRRQNKREEEKKKGTGGHHCAIFVLSFYCCIFVYLCQEHFDIFMQILSAVLSPISFDSKKINPYNDLLSFVPLKLPRVLFLYLMMHLG